jgi:hypothetical protein
LIEAKDIIEEVSDELDIHSLGLNGLEDKAVVL